MKNLIFCQLLALACLCACGAKETIRTPIEVECFDLPVLFGSNLMYNSNYPCDSLLYLHDVENPDNILVCQLVKNGVAILDTVRMPSIVPYYEMFILAYDSIACFSHFPMRTMTLVHNDGSIVDTLSLGDSGAYVCDISQQPRIGNTVCFANTDDSIIRSNVLRSEYFRTVKPVFRYDLAEGEGESWGTFPEVLETAIGFEETPTICIVDDSTIVLSFMCIDSLYLYVNSELQSRHQCKSRYIDQFPEFDTTKVFDMGYRRLFSKARPMYSNLLHDPSSQRFFRIAIHEQPIEEQGKKITKTNRTWSLMVINKSMEVEEEYLFRYMNHLPFYVIPNHRGLFISKTPIDKNNMRLKLSLFKL